MHHIYNCSFGRVHRLSTLCVSVAEIAEGRYSVVKDKPIIVSALGAIEKPNKDICLIHDCSRPSGFGVNDYASLPYKMIYRTVKEACKLLKKNSFMIKVDLKSNYRSTAIILHPSQYQYTELKWKLKGDTEPTYM